jgi:opacity protein-like surface antigen
MGRAKDEAMVSAKSFLSTLTAITISMGGAAYAADIGPPPYPPPPVVPEQSPWYLRGDIGFGLESSTLLFLQNPLNTTNFAFDHSSLADTPFLRGGIGYDVNNWLRFDSTAEYRFKTAINAFGQFTSGGTTLNEAYQGYLTSLVLLENAYIDLGTWAYLTPFVGAGVGGAKNSVYDFTETGSGSGSISGTGPAANKWDFAWAAYAGVAYNVTNNFKIDLTYRYLNFGSVTDTINCIGGCNPNSYKWNSLTSQDFMIGFRGQL